MRLRYTPRARADLQDISAYIRERSPSAARAVIAAIRRTVSGLASFPYLGRRTDSDAETYVLSVGRYPYLVFYWVVGREVLIIHVRHGSRDRAW